MEWSRRPSPAQQAILVDQTDSYPLDRAQHYAVHHHSSLRNKLTNKREQQVLAAALQAAGQPKTALDLPCGTGRFWPVFAQCGVDNLIAADGSAGMLDVAAQNRLGEQHPSQLIATSAFDIALRDGAVEFAACLRFYHHLGRAEDRAQLLAEMRRVSSRYVAISLWVDGNLAGNRRLQRPTPDATPGYGRRRCRKRADVEDEFRAAGFTIRAHFDVWPLIYMWRLYLLERDAPPLSSGH
jgi:SAM-dependent methyltransferase